MRSTHSPSEDGLFFFTKRSLAELLQISVRSVNRLLAAEILPPADFEVGRFPRWSRKTIERWLATKPKLPARRKGDRS
jgi:hypothetical protein